MGLYAAIVGGIVRMLMSYLSGQGVEIASAQVNAAIDALLVIGTLVWTITNKLSADRKLKDAKAGLL